MGVSHSPPDAAAPPAHRPPLRMSQHTLMSIGAEIEQAELRVRTARTELVSAEEYLAALKHRLKELREEGLVKALCIACMKNQADPKNGGLCYSCAPPLRIVLWGRRAYRRHPC